MDLKDKFKELEKLGSPEKISDMAFQLYVEFGEDLSQEQDSLLLDLIAINEGEQFELSDHELASVIQKLLDS